MTKSATSYANFKAGQRKTGRIPDLWDGKTASRIADILLSATL